MVFSSTVFLFLFLPAVLAAYYLPVFRARPERARAYRNVVLTLFSLGFYAWGEPAFIFMMLFSILLNGLLARGMDRAATQRARKRWLIAAVGFDIALMFVFKYLSFVLQNIGLLLRLNAPQWNIALPIGISFFTFQIMSYVFDVYYRSVPVQKSMLRLTLYISMFPQLIAGPIVRYEDVADEIGVRRESLADFSSGFARFSVGLAKKVLLANYVALIADNLFARTSVGLSVCSAWLGAIAYTLQIYFDFSGYSDMAIGLGRMFGFHFIENFNYPYIASSVTDFWRRWHISLSTWFRDYVYIPLGGSRVARGKWVRNLFVVWLLTGIWHGANWTFLVWGLFFFALLLLERTTGLAAKLRGFSHLYTLLMVVVGWVLFRSESLSLAGTYLGAMFGIGATGFSDGVFTYYLSGGKWILLAASIACLPVVPWVRRRARLPRPLVAAAVAVLFVLAVVVCVKATYNPFIYFNF